MNDPRSSATVPTPLDPNYLLDIENDARHLATSVDSLVENLASILHNISALTVDAIEVYRLVKLPLRVTIHFLLLVFLNVFGTGWI